MLLVPLYLHLNEGLQKLKTFSLSLQSVTALRLAYREKSVRQIIEILALQLLP